MRYYWVNFDDEGKPFGVEDHGETQIFSLPRVFEPGEKGRDVYDKESGIDRLAGHVGAFDVVLSARDELDAFLVADAFVKKLGLA